MSYPTLPDRAVPFHNDGTVVKLVSPSEGVVKHFNASEMAELNDQDFTKIATSGNREMTYLVFFFPEKRDITGALGIADIGAAGTRGLNKLEGSNDTTNGMDGTWETATADDGLNSSTMRFDSWRDGGNGGEGWQDVSFASGPYETVRMEFDATTTGANLAGVYIAHLYGSKGAGETADDITFVDPDNSNVEFSLPQDFGPVPAGTSQIDKFAIKNESATLTANTIDIAVDDPDDIVRISDSSSGPWNVSMSITSLAAGAVSATYYVKSEAPAPPTQLEPKRAPINVTVGSWS